MSKKYPEVPFTTSNTLTFINIKAGFALFGDDIIVPAQVKIGEMMSVYVIGPCPHMGGNVFTIPTDAYEHPTLH